MKGGHIQRLRGLWRAAALAVCLRPDAASAHPHIFVDARVGFVLDEAGRLGAVRVTWVFDAFYSMLLLMEMGLDPVGRPDTEGLARIAALQTDWGRDYGGLGTLAGSAGDVALGPAHRPEADVVGGQIEIRFERPLPAPVAPDGLGLALYDPLYFVAYVVVDATVEGKGCTASVQPFRPDARLGALQRELSRLGPEETVSDPGIGRLFADRAVLQCG
jgi:ABC-type uncharacterized transport system substrate-binding protein